VDVAAGVVGCVWANGDGDAREAGYCDDTSLVMKRKNTLTAHRLSLSLSL